MNKKAGRKPIYTDQELLRILNKYIDQNPNKKITIADLERKTGVSYNIWKFNKKIRVVIDELNNPPIISPQDGFRFTLPNAKQLVDNYYNNKPKLIKAIQDCLDVIEDLYDYANIGFNAQKKEEENKKETSRLEALIKKKDEEIKKLNNEIDQLYLASSSPSERRNRKLKDNLIELTPERIKSISKDIKDITEEYNGLFDD